MSSPIKSSNLVQSGSNILNQKAAEKNMMSSPKPNTFNKNSVSHGHPTTTFRRWRQKISFRRKRLPMVRLGGEKKPRRGFILVKLFRRVKLKYILKKLKQYYRSLVKDIVEGGGALDSFQQRLILETSFAVPVMGLSFNTFASHY
nr:uncharacterized protein LOC117281673 [Nicotiana tomentosiformis]